MQKLHLVLSALLTLFTSYTLAGDMNWCPACKKYEIIISASKENALCLFCGQGFYKRTFLEYCCQYSSSVCSTAVEKINFGLHMCNFLSFLAINNLSQTPESASALTDKCTTDLITHQIPRTDETQWIITPLVPYAIFLGNSIGIAMIQATLNKLNKKHAVILYNIAEKKSEDVYSKLFDTFFQVQSSIKKHLHLRDFLIVRALHKAKKPNHTGNLIEEALGIHANLNENAYIEYCSNSINQPIINDQPEKLKAQEEITSILNHMQRQRQDTRFALILYTQCKHSGWDITSTSTNGEQFETYHVVSNKSKQHPTLDETTKHLLKHVKTLEKVGIYLVAPNE